ncbi:MAG TPA: hypothetical protein VGF90_05480 [Verrucomicrobiae bacterium]
MTYVEIIDSLPKLSMVEQMTIRDLLLEMIGPPQPARRGRPKTLNEIEIAFEKSQRKAMYAALRMLQRRKKYG